MIKIRQETFKNNVAMDVGQNAPKKATERERVLIFKSCPMMLIFNSEKVER